MKICVPLRFGDYDRGCAALARAAATTEVDFIELWLDEIPNLATFFSTQKKNLVKPFIVVNKGPEEGGCFNGDETARVAKLTAALPYGPFLVDVDFSTPPALVAELKKNKGKTGLMLSHHDFRGGLVLSELRATLAGMTLAGADFVKFAVTVNDDRDFAVFCDLWEVLRSAPQPFVLTGMGAKGRLARLMGALCGSQFTFAFLEGDQATAASQMTVEKWLDLCAQITAD